jgi:hypothetical protein
MNHTKKINVYVINNFNSTIRKDTLPRDWAPYRYVEHASRTGKAGALTYWQAERYTIVLL